MIQVRDVLFCTLLLKQLRHEVFTIDMDALDNGKCTVNDSSFNLPPLLYSSTSADEDFDVNTFKTISLGIEGSANKIGVGIIRCTCTRTRINPTNDQTKSSEYQYKYFYEILCNPRKTYITPAGQGNSERFVTILSTYN